MGIGDFVGSGDARLDSQLLFTAEIDKMTEVLRRTLLINGSRRENDAEHSWHIAVMALLFSEYALEPVDIGRVVQMCVVHDLVEIVAGDTFAYDEEGNRDKEERERKAADQLFSKLQPDQAAMIRSLWEEFDRMETADAKYAACMDRLQPFLHNTLTNGHTWVEGGTDCSMVEKRMDILREFMPKVYEWMRLNLRNGVEKGWLRP